MCSENSRLLGNSKVKTGAEAVVDDEELLLVSAWLLLLTIGINTWSDELEKAEELDELDEVTGTFGVLPQSVRVA